MAEPPKRSRWDLLAVPDAPRRTATWLVGMGLGIWETVAQVSPRAQVYAFCGTLIGVPELIARLRKEKQADDDPAE